MTPIASRSLCATNAVAPAMSAPSAAAPPSLTFGVNGPIRRAPMPNWSAAALQRRPPGGRHPGVARAGEVDQVPVPERGEVRHDLAAALDVVEDDAGQAGQLPAHQYDGRWAAIWRRFSSGSRLAASTNPSTAGDSRWICSYSTRGDSSALTRSSVYSETRARISAPRISSK